MKYYEVFPNGMPLELYRMTEKDRLKQNFNIKGEKIIEYLEPDTDTRHDPVGLFLIASMFLVAMLGSFFLGYAVGEM